MTVNFEDLSADLVNHAIEGYLHTGEHVNIPLISHITDNLYVGGCIDGVDLGDFFSHVFSMYKWEAYKVAPETKVYTVTMYDDHSGPDPDEIDKIARTVADALDTGGNVLVHCQAGINRSNLIAAASLMKWKGMTAAEAIDFLRSKRSNAVLANRTFYEFLRGLDG